MGCRKGVSEKSPALQREILARRLQGQSKSSIAKELHIDRETVTRVEVVNNVPQMVEEWKAYIAKEVVPLAVEAVSAQIRDRKAPGDGDLGLKVLTGTGVLRHDGPPVTVSVSQRAQFVLAKAAELGIPGAVKQLPVHPAFSAGPASGESACDSLAGRGSCEGLPSRLDPASPES